MICRRPLLAQALVITALVAGCGDPCENLAPVCADCLDASYRNDCEAIVAKQNHAVCSADLASFRDQCPARPASTNSTGSSATGAGGN